MIGMPGLIEFDTIEENAKLCHELSLDFLELNMNLPMYNYKIDVDEVKRCLEKYQLKVTFHLAENLDPFELDPILRKASLDNFKEAVRIGTSIGAFLYNMHLSKGIHFTLPDKKVRLYEIYKEEYIQNVKSFIEVVESYDINLCIENTGIHHLDYVKEATDLLLQSDNIHLTYDIGHDITSGYNDRGYYQSRVSEIKHYHIHDGTKDNNHLPLFTGDLDIIGFMKQASDNNATCVVEVKSKEQLTYSINQLRKQYETIFNKTWTDRVES